ncbi:hypothetical protein [Catellatospora sichuanensis]|uniref:hypothetical protein n=1 Tax=Catellatospora sichuanensis TaxID=1969805 RepID=UPI001183C1E4|nr:hypothetical protein [Catellatospora sichuanensis]
MLLAVPAVPGAAWTTDNLAGLLRETLDLAQLRLVDLEMLTWLGRYLPAVYLPDGAVGTVPGIKFNRQWQLAEFQGEDGGAPIASQLVTEATPISRFRPGTPTTRWTCPRTGHWSTWSSTARHRLSAGCAKLAFGPFRPMRQNRSSYSLGPLGESRLACSVPKKCPISCASSAGSKLCAPTWTWVGCSGDTAAPPGIELVDHQREVAGVGQVDTEAGFDDRPGIEAEVVPLLAGVGQLEPVEYREGDAHPVAGLLREVLCDLVDESAHPRLVEVGDPRRVGTPER